MNLKQEMLKEKTCKSKAFSCILF